MLRKGVNKGTEGKAKGIFSEPLGLPGATPATVEVDTGSYYVGVLAE